MKKIFWSVLVVILLIGLFYFYNKKAIKVDENYVNNLMEKYKTKVCDKQYLVTLDDEEITYIAFLNAKKSGIKCNELDIKLDDLHKCDENSKQVSYDELLKTKKELFGNHITLKKETMLDFPIKLYYKDDNYYGIKNHGGYGCIGEANITGFKLENDCLKVYTEITIESAENYKNEYVFKKYKNTYYLEQINDIS